MIPSEIPLPTTFQSNGFTLSQVERTGDRAIFSQSLNGRLIAFEAVIIKHSKARTLPNGRLDPPREQYPSPRDWGHSAWTCMNLDRARQKLSLR